MAGGRIGGGVRMGSTTVGAVAVVLLLSAGPTPPAGWAPAAHPEPTPPVPAASAPRAEPAARAVPADLLDLRPWKLTLPTGDEERPTEITQPDLDRYADEHFRLNATRDGVVFSADTGGATTSGSKYPRSELREMAGRDRAGWSNTTGRHVLSVRESITAVPPNKPEVVAAQIHGGEDDVLQIRLEGRELSVQYDDGAEQVVLDPAYRLGTPFDIDLVAEAGKVAVFHNGVQRAIVDREGTGWYFKVGAYVQSNGEHDDPDAVGQVVVHRLQITHH